MIHIGYFSLLFFCISANMTHSMDGFMDLTQNTPHLQTEEESYDSWRWNSINFNETSDNFIPSPLETVTPAELALLQAQKNRNDLWKCNFINNSTFSQFEFSDQGCPTLPEKYSNPSDIFPEMFYTTDRSSNSQPQPEAPNLSISSSSSRKRYSLSAESKNINNFMDLTQQSSTENLETIPQQPILKNLSPMLNELPSSKTKSFISFDDEYSTVFDQEFDDQEIIISGQSSSKQRPRKKRKLDLPDNTYFTITCTRCPLKPQFWARNKSQLTGNFKNHFEKKHSNIPEKEIQNYIKEHLRKPKNSVQFAVNCPESECNHTAHSVQGWKLKGHLFSHISDKHPEKKRNYSTESVATYTKKNCKQTVVPAQRKLKNKNFVIACNHCSPKVQFKTQHKNSVISHFKRHLKKKHSNIIDQQTKNYIKQHLQEPELLVKFLIDCPEPKCKYIAHAVHRSNLKTRLSKHISSEHQENKDNHSVQSIKTYVEGSAQEQLNTTKKRKTNK